MMLVVILIIMILNLLSTAGLIGIWIYDHFKYDTVIMDEEGEEIDSKIKKIIGNIV